MKGAKLPVLTRFNLQYKQWRRENQGFQAPAQAREASTTSASDLTWPPGVILIEV
jgi:hypothetical protein